MMMCLSYSIFFSCKACSYFKSHVCNCLRSFCMQKLYKALLSVETLRKLVFSDNIFQNELADVLPQFNCYLFLRIEFSWSTQFKMRVTIQTKSNLQDDIKNKTRLEELISTVRDNSKSGALKLTEYNWRTFLNLFSNLIYCYPLHAAIALHARKALVPFLKGANDFYPGLDRQNEMQSSVASYLQFTIQKIYINAFDCFLQHEPEYSQLFSKPALKMIVEQGNINRQLTENQSTTKIRKLLINLSKIVIENENFRMRKDLNVFIQNQLLILEPTMALQEIALNYIKRKVEAAQNEIATYLCCRIHFERYTTSQQSGFNETSNQEFKDYHWPLTNDSIIKHLTKTFVGFLNTTGGIIYVGLKEDKSKIVEVKGIELSNLEKKEFLHFIHDKIMSNVYPKDLDRQEDERQYQQFPNLNRESLYRQKLQKQFTRQKSPETGYEYRISKYVSVDFLDVFDGETLLNSIGEKHRLYIIRIKIKVGHPQQLYHIINQHRIPETYIREDKSVKKKDIKEFYDLFYKKISGTEFQQLQSQKKDPHSLCRFNPSSINKESFM